MRHPKSNQTGSSGNYAVMQKFIDIGWKPIQVPVDQDIGTDLLVTVSDSRLFDLLVVVGAQVKSGKSAFEHPRNDEGWDYYSDAEHADYWSNHRCPHLMVLFDPDTNIAYWNHINLKTAKSTGKGYKIFVPRAQRIELGQLDALLGMALSTAQQPAQGGNVFNASANSVAPLARMRTALLSPRLLAPHGNRGRVDELEPEEILALVAQVKVMQLNWQINDRTFWKSLNEPPSTKDWRWQFVYSLWVALTQNKLDKLVASFQSADREDWRAAALSCLVARYFEQSLFAEAKYLLDTEIARDKAEPTDHAWLRLHRSRIRAELGEIAGAIDDAQQAQVSLAKRSDDVTAMLLFSVALKSQYELLHFEDGKPDLAQLVNSGDNPASWWQSQQISWALDAAAEDQFKAWARDTSLELTNDPTDNKLLAPKLIAGFAANHSAWRHATMRHARHAIQYAKSATEIAYELQQLLRAGAKSELKLAVTRFFQDGPSAAIADLLKCCVPNRFSHTVWDSIVCLWRDFGELADETSADSVIRWSLAQFEPESIQLKLVNQDLRSARSMLMDLVKGAMTCASDLAQSEVADFLLSEKLNTAVPQESRAKALDLVRTKALNAQHDIVILALLHKDLDETFMTSVFRAALKRELPEATSRAMSAIKDGNWYLYSRVIDLLKPEASLLGTIVDAISTSLKRCAADSEKMKYGVGGVDQAALLAKINLEYPSVSDWQVLIDFLLNPQVNADKKSSACMLIAKDAARVPEKVAQQLVAGCHFIAQSKYLPKNIFDLNEQRKPATDLASFMHCALADLADGELDDTFAELITGDAKHIVRALQLLYLKPQIKFDFFILWSLRHEDFGIRVNAASTLGKYISAHLLTPAIRKGILIIANLEDVQTQFSFLNSLDIEIHHILLEPILQMCAHPSCKVRTLAQRLIESRKLTTLD